MLRPSSRVMCKSSNSGESIDLGGEDELAPGKRAREEEGEVKRVKRIKITHPEYMRMGRGT